MSANDIKIKNILKNERQKGVDLHRLYNTIAIEYPEYIPEIDLDLTINDSFSKLKTIDGFNLVVKTRVYMGKDFLQYNLI